MFAWILRRVSAKLAGWKEQLISKGGKEILLKSVVQALPNYAMSIFKLPVSLCKSIEQKIAQFLWQNSYTKSGIHWKSWDLLQERKENGGLGFRDLLSLNKALLGKQAWRISQCPSSLWSRVFKGLYFHSTDFWHAPRGSTPSWGWQSLLLGRDSISAQLQWLVGNDQCIHICNDKWLARGTLGRPTRRGELEMVGSFIQQNQTNWNVPLLRQSFDDQIIREIVTIPLNSIPTTYQIIWTGTPTGDYTVKSIYKFIKQNAPKHIPNSASISPQLPSSVWRKIWQLKTAPKLRNISSSTQNVSYVKLIFLKPPNTYFYFAQRYRAFGPIPKCRSTFQHTIHTGCLIG